MGFMKKGGAVKKSKIKIKNHFQTCLEMAKLRKKIF
jgi:hypothetical protein